MKDRQGTRYNRTMKKPAPSVIGRMNSFGEVALELVGRPWHDSKGNRIQSIKVRFCDGKKDVRGYHVSELSQFSMDPNSSAAKAVVKREREHYRKWAEYEKKCETFEKKVINLLKKDGIKAYHAGRGIIHVEVAGPRQVQKIIREVPCKITGPLRSWDNSRIITPTTVRYSTNVERAVIGEP